MNNYIKIVAILFFILPSAALSSPSVDWDSVCEEAKVFNEKTGTYEWKGARGRYFCLQQEEKNKEERKNQTKQTKKPKEKDKKTEKERCEDPDTWTSDCGFINPDKLPPKKAFAFQEKQRDRLIQDMSMNPGSMKVVVEGQKYMNWMVGKAMKLGDMYNYSAVQNPSLDPNTRSTVNNMAQRLISSRQLSNKKMFWAELRSWNAELIFFTRASCDFCSKQSEILNFVKEDSGLPLVEVALEDECVSSTAEECISGKEGLAAAEHFGVKNVPAVMVFVPNEEVKTPEDGLWLHITNGFNSAETISRRLYDYLNAWHSAAAKGVENALDSPDFGASGRHVDRSQLKNQLNKSIGSSEGSE